jgi:hypothetical protein
VAHNPLAALVAAQAGGPTPGSLAATRDHPQFSSSIRTIMQAARDDVAVAADENRRASRRIFAVSNPLMSAAAAQAASQGQSSNGARQ